MKYLRVTSDIKSLKVKLEFALKRNYQEQKKALSVRHRQFELRIMFV